MGGQFISAPPLTAGLLWRGRGGGGSDIKQWKTQEFIAVERLKHNSETVLFVQFQYEKKKTFLHIFIYNLHIHIIQYRYIILYTVQYTVSVALAQYSNSRFFIV